MTDYTLDQFKELPNSDLNNFAQICLDKLSTEFGKDIEISRISFSFNDVFIYVKHNSDFVSTITFNVTHVNWSEIDKTLKIQYRFKFKGNE